jgi:hypothetical protein
LRTPASQRSQNPYSHSHSTWYRKRGQANLGVHPGEVFVRAPRTDTSDPDLGVLAAGATVAPDAHPAVWNKWEKLRVHIKKPKLGLGRTNNASERGHR